MTEGKAPLSNRLRREGRWEEASAWKDAEIKRLRAAGLPRTEARETAWQALAAKYPPLESPDEDDDDEPSDAELRAEEEEDAAFYASQDGLSATADFAVEMEWVSAHPALMRRLQGAPLPVRLTPEDVLGAPNGPAPSRRAVGSLQHWVNDPGALFRLIARDFPMGFTGKFGAASGEALDDLTEAYRILKQYEVD